MGKELAYTYRSRQNTVHTNNILTINDKCEDHHRYRKVGEPAYLIHEENVITEMITPGQCVDLKNFIITNYGANFVISTRGREVGWADASATDKITSRLAKLWATEELLNMMEGEGAMNGKIQKERLG